VVAMKNNFKVKINQEKLELALDKYRKREVSLGKAADIAGVPIVLMMEIAAENKIPINYTKEDLLRDFKAT
tara:strand:+ start:271 stop:483 length:213 start_codon:yes stop_codon:yes gene_type:complete